MTMDEWVKSHMTVPVSLVASVPASATSPAAAGPAPAPAAPAATAPATPAPAVDPVVYQQLSAAKAEIDRLEAVMGQREVEQKKLLKEADKALRISEEARLKTEAELAAMRAAVPPSGLLGIIPPEMVGKFEEFRQRAETEEGRTFLAAFAAGDDAAVDMVKMMVTPIVEAMVKKIPAGQIDLAGRSVDVMGGILMHALRERAEEEENTETEVEQPGPASVPDPVAAPAPRQHPLKKGKARRVNRHGTLDELADLVGTGELRVRAA